MTTPILTTTDTGTEPLPELHGTMRPRHITMLAMGGVIGSGLFIGSGAGIEVAGPGIVLSFVAAGVLTMLVMRMLAEMAASFPSSGSFSAHAERAFGPWAGFTIGWLYWTALVVVLALESTAAAIIVNGWLPAVPQWVLMLAFMAVFTGVNLTEVANFGEFEFWFALIKVAAIVGFLVLGVLAIIGVLPAEHSHALSGGLLPHGWSGVGAGLITAVSAFGGLEVVTIAAAESEDPARATVRAVRSAVWRISVFYIGSMIVMVSLLPWNDSRLGASPFVAVLNDIGVPAAGRIMSVVVLIALLSALNANTYAAARMVFSLAQRRQAPRLLTRLNRTGVPYAAVLASTAFGFVGVVLNLLWPQTVFLHLLDAIGTVLLLVWILIACSQLRLRRGLSRTAPVRMWGHPYLSWAALTAMVALIVYMFIEPDTRIQVISTAVLGAVVLAAALIRTRRATGRRG